MPQTISLESLYRRKNVKTSYFEVWLNGGYFENVEDLKGKQRKCHQQRQGIMSKKLATIITDIDIEFNETKLLLKDFNGIKSKLFLLS